MNSFMYLPALVRKCSKQHFLEVDLVILMRDPPRSGDHAFSRVPMVSSSSPTLESVATLELTVARPNTVSFIKGIGSALFRFCTRQVS